MVLELARRGVGGNAVALDPGGFWTSRQRRFFELTIGASMKLTRKLQGALPTLTGNPVGPAMLLGQFSAHPGSLPAPLVLAELRAFATPRCTGSTGAGTSRIGTGPSRRPT